MLEKLRGSNSPAPTFPLSGGTDEALGRQPLGNIATLWEDICSLSRDQAANYFIDHRNSLDLQHFYFLLDKAEIEGRKSRERGEELYEISLDALRTIEVTQRKEFMDEKILGYAYLANTRRLRFDMDGAREVFRTIDRITPETLAPATSLQASYFRVSFLWWERDVSSAIRLVEEILPEARSRASRKLLSRVLLIAGELYLCNGHIDRALPIFEEAVKYVPLIYDPYIAFAAYYSLSYLHAGQSNVHRATEFLEKARRVHEDGSRADSGIYVSLLEAMILRADGNLRAAESAFLEAREGFSGMGSGIYAALTSLELALLYLELQESDRALSMATSSISCISQFPYHKEAIAALAILEEAAKKKAINEKVISRTLHHLELVRVDPTSQFPTQ